MKSIKYEGNFDGMVMRLASEMTKFRDEHGLRDCFLVLNGWKRGDWTDCGEATEHSADTLFIGVWDTVDAMSYSHRDAIVFERDGAAAVRLEP